MLLEIFFIRGVINEKRLVEKRDGGVVDDDAASGVGMVLDRWMEDDWFWMLTGVDLSMVASHHIGTVHGFI